MFSQKYSLNVSFKTSLNWRCIGTNTKLHFSYPKTLEQNQYQKKGQYNSQFGSQGQSQYNRNRQQNGYNRDNNGYRNNRGYGNNNGYRNNGYQRRNYQTPQIGDQGRLMQTTENDDAVKMNKNSAFIESVAESNAQPVTKNINEKVIVKNETIDVTEEPVKRKRGRPRKNQ